VLRITPEQLRQAAPLESVLPDFFSFVGDDIIVGHFIGMDMDFISRAATSNAAGHTRQPSCGHHAAGRHLQKTGDGQISRKQRFGFGRVNLQRLTEEFDIFSFNAHDALEDALQTAYPFLFPCEKVATRGVVTLADYRRAGQGLPWAAM
jgi:DNA polymerase-3 subunit epsilon